MLPIKGFEKTSLIDYPPYTSSVIFIGGCNFRCKYCQNSDLVLKYKELPSLNEQEILKHLEEKKMWIDAVVITGGEPTLYNELIDFVRSIKKLGMKVKLDTNGTNPELMWDMMEEGLLDYVAMDIKAPYESYENLTVFPVDMEKIKKSISLIKNSGVDYEFRTTPVPGLVNKEDVENIGKWLSGAKRYILQYFRVSHGILDKELENNTSSYTYEDLNQMAKTVEPFFEEVLVR